jgi:hypothetical protein
MRRILFERLRRHIAQSFDPRALAWAELRASAATLERSLSTLSRSLDRADQLVDDIGQANAARLQRFTAEMTVHAAWARHPGVAAVFAARHLPACPDCAVGADETLAEAAFGYALDLQRLLDQLNGLLDAVPTPPGS